MMESIVKRYKVVIIGESNVGKTALTLQFVKEVFNTFNSTSSGGTCFRKNICIDETVITLDIWDTAGCERFRSIVPMFYREMHAAIFVYDINDRDSFEKLNYWVKNLRANVSSDSKIVYMVAANKSDLPNKVEVNIDDGKNYADTMGFMFMKTSAKTGENVAKMFTAIGKELLNASYDDGDDDLEHIKVKTQ